MTLVSDWLHHAIVSRPLKRLPYVRYCTGMVHDDILPPPVEEWLCVSSHPSYEVSSHGRVRRGSRVLKASPTGSGYSKVTLVVGGHRRQCYVHHLVLEEFVGPGPPGHEARHTNNNRSDNSLTNLAWGSYQDNLNDSLQAGRRRCAIPQGTREAIRLARAAGESIASVSVRLDVSARTVRRWGGPSTRKRLEPHVVDSIRIRLGEGKGLRAIGREFGCSAPTVMNIRDGVTWKNQ